MKWEARVSIFIGYNNNIAFLIFKSLKLGCLSNLHLRAEISTYLKNTERVIASIYFRFLELKRKENNRQINSGSNVRKNT